MDNVGIHTPSPSPHADVAVAETAARTKRGGLGTSNVLVDEKKIDSETLKESLQKLEDITATFDRHLKFELHEEANVLQIVVSDASDHDRVIRKIPPDEIVKLVENMNKMLGMIFDREV